jgi:calcineurin-like phosphoesterase family protein
MTDQKTHVDRTHRFIGDTHFGHAGILGRAARPWNDIEKHDRSLIEHWNSVVSPTDTVWHLGDFAHDRLPLGQAAAIFARLDGIKRLIVGNHDTDAVRDLSWASVDDIRVLTAGGQDLVLCHYPMREWPNWWGGALHFHGHTHDRLPSSNRSWDCGVDHQGFVPLTFDEIRARMNVLPELDFAGNQVKPFIVAVDKT